MEKDKMIMAVQLLLDDSGSMRPIRNTTIKAVNEFMWQLATALTPVSVSITKFGCGLNSTIVDNLPVYEMPKITQDDYNPRDGTNIAWSVVEVIRERMDKMNAYQKVLVVLTDGLDSSSFKAEARKMIDERRKQGWLVIFLGTIAPELADNPDLEYAEQMLQYAKDLGIPAGLTMTFDNKNIEEVMAKAALAALAYSGAGAEHDAETALA